MTDIIRGTVRKIIADAGYKAFTFDGSRTAGLSTTAEKLLQGLSYYFDRGTRRSFGSRVLKLEELAYGAVLGCIESVTPPHGQKIYRPVFFDFTGHVIERRSADESFASYPKARAAYETYRAQLDWAQIVQDALDREHRTLQRRAGDIQYALTLLASARSKAE